MILCPIDGERCCNNSCSGAVCALTREPVLYECLECGSRVPWPETCPACDEADEYESADE